MEHSTCESRLCMQSVGYYCTVGLCETPSSRICKVTATALHLHMHSPSSKTFCLFYCHIVLEKLLEHQFYLLVNFP